MYIESSSWYQDCIAKIDAGRTKNIKNMFIVVLITLGIFLFSFFALPHLVPNGDMHGWPFAILLLSGLCLFSTVLTLFSLLIHTSKSLISKFTATLEKSLYTPEIFRLFVSELNAPPVVTVPVGNSKQLNYLFTEHFIITYPAPGNDSALATLQIVYLPDIAHATIKQFILNGSSSFDFLLYTDSQKKPIAKFNFLKRKLYDNFIDAFLTVRPNFTITDEN